MQFYQHVAKQGALLDGIVQGDVGMGERGKPALGHVFFGAAPVIRFEQGHSQGFDIQG